MKSVSFVLIGAISAATALCFVFIPKPVNSAIAPAHTELYREGITAQGKQDKWVAPPAAGKVTNPVASNEQSIAAGKTIYEKDCINCHGKKGRGDGKDAANQDVTVADLSSDKVQAQTDGEIFWKISEGRKPMPSNKKDHSADQIWQLVNYVRTLAKKK